MVMFAILVPGDHTIVLSDPFAGDPTSLDLTVHLHVSGPGPEDQLVGGRIVEEGRARRTLM
jgi:hypothetical protein